MLYVIESKVIVEGTTDQHERLSESLRGGRLRRALDKVLAEHGFEVKTSETSVHKPWKDDALTVPRKIHLYMERPDEVNRDTVCRYHANSAHVTRSRKLVTCKVCKKRRGIK